MKRYWLIGLVAALALQLMVSMLSAEETNTIEIIKQLQKRIEELEQKVKSLDPTNVAPAAEGTKQNEELDQRVKILERNRALEVEASETKAKESPKLTVGSDGFGYSSADGQFGLQLKGVLQVDSRTFFDDSGTRGNDGFLLRRARPIIQGTLWKDFDFLFLPEFGGSGAPQIFDAYVNYRYKPELQLRVGKFKSPIGLEQLQADVDTLFNERSLVTDLVPNRDLGAMLHGDVFDGVFSYAAGMFNGVGDARNSSNVDLDDNKSAQGRLFFHPFKRTSSTALQGLGFGVSGSYEDMQGTNTIGLPGTIGGTLPGYATDGQQQFFAYNPGSNALVVADGEHWRVSPQAYYYYGPFGFLTEYVISNQKVSRVAAAPFVSERLNHEAWQITGSWILTGEDASFKGGVTPRKRFNPAEGGWGAVQLVARYAELDIDDAAFPLFSTPSSSASSASEWSVGLNWYLNKNVLVKVSFSHTDFNGGGGSGGVPASVTRQDENVLFTRVQLSF
jgi:phosphate-selective porin OprO and OprP